MSLRGVYLEHLTWAEAEPILRADWLIVIPVGAGAKEHGSHHRGLSGPPPGGAR